MTSKPTTFHIVLGYITVAAIIAIPIAFVVHNRRRINAYRERRDAETIIGTALQTGAQGNVVSRSIVAPTSSNDASVNFTELQKNIGVKSKNGSTVTVVNISGFENDYGYKVIFYNNNRFSFFPLIGDGYIFKGTYKNGGKEMISDMYPNTTVKGNPSDNIESLMKNYLILNKFKF